MALRLSEYTTDMESNKAFALPSDRVLPYSANRRSSDGAKIVAASHRFAELKRSIASRFTVGIAEHTQAAVRCAGVRKHRNRDRQLPLAVPYGEL